MGTRHSTAGYSNPVLIGSAIIQSIRLDSCFYFFFLRPFSCLDGPFFFRSRDGECSVKHEDLPNSIFC